MAKKIKHSSQYYNTRYKKLKQIHKFNFRYRPTGNYTPSQKAALTRVYKKYESHLRQIDKGRATFKVATSSQRKNLSKAVNSTNKGIIVYGFNVNKIRITGKGKKTKLKIKRGRIREEYFNVENEGFDNVSDLTDWVLKVFKPDYITLAVNDYIGTANFSPTAWLNYRAEITEKDIDIRKNYDDKSPFHGIYALWLT